MRTFEIKYQLRGQNKSDLINAFSNIGAVALLLGRLSRRDRAFFKIIGISLL